MRTTVSLSGALALALALSTPVHGANLLGQRTSADASIIDAINLGPAAIPRIPDAGSALVVAGAWTDEEIAAITAERAVYGLETNATVLAQLASDPDPFARDSGVPLTRSEGRLIDLPGRWEFESLVGEVVVPYVSKLDHYGGIYFDQSNGGAATILLTRPDDGVERAVRALVGEYETRVTFQTARHSYTSLRRALDSAWSQWSRMEVGMRPAATSVDVKRNAVALHFDQRDGMARQVDIDALSSALGVRVVQDAAGSVAQSEAQVCTSRTNCYDPTEAGIKITSPQDGYSVICTQGFHISIAGDEQFVSGGHCSFGQTVKDWYHYAFGKLGGRKATLYGGEAGCGTQIPCKDVMRVQMSDAQASWRVYWLTTTLTLEGRRNPIDGESVCASLGNSNVIDCGTIVDAVVGPLTDDNGVLISYLASVSGIITKAGDSGSPYYHRNGATEDVVALGIHKGQAGTTRYFTRIQSFMGTWGADLVTDPD